nr:hypothetical protein [uncultured Flavobacterium sp.]
MTAYIDSNILIDLEQNTLSKEQLDKKFGNKIESYFYSFGHLFEAHEISGSEQEKTERLAKRFKTITDLTINSYLSYDIEKHEFDLLIKAPEPIFNNIPLAKANIDYVRGLVNEVTIEQKSAAQKLFGIPSVELNNFTPEQIIEQIENRKDIYGGLSFKEFVAEIKEGEELKLYEQISGMIELLDIYGFWKDKPTQKSNYARAWDGIHIFYSSYCDIFITNDLRTRNKAKVIFKLYGINTKVFDSNGE